MTSANHSIAIPPPTVIDTLRTAKMAPLGPLGVQSGINKQSRSDRILASSMGLSDDEHDLTFHGGIDKAIHQYSSDNYPLWREMFDDADLSAKFVPGGFGENIAAHGFTERNICIGDRVRVGPKGPTAVGGDSGTLLEVSLPRQPCFKLNQRFGIKNFAPKTIDLARTGWYYRVIEPGYMQAGDEVRVIERPNPQWTIERLQHYLHKDKNISIMEQLMEIPQMGKECKNNLQKQVDKIRKAAEPKPVEVFRPFKIVTKEPETHKVMYFVLEALKRSAKDDSVSAGSHVCLRLPNGLSRSYSIVGGTMDLIELGIAREDNSRGGSIWLHDTAKVGDILDCGSITQSLKPAGMASRHILIAGGIGITAFPVMVKTFKNIGFDHMLHYAVQSGKDVAFKDHLDESGAIYHIYDKSKGQRMDIEDILRNRVWNSHVFVCGPQRMIDDVVASAKAEGMADEEIHFETFRADISGDPFSATVVTEGPNGKEAEVKVGEDETLLDVIRKAGFECGSSCEAGNCGTCRVAVKEGKVEHRGSALNEDEKKHEMLSCVSRGIGHITIEL